MTGKSNDSKAVIKFMRLFAELKNWVDDDPIDLVSDAIRDESIRDLCDKLSSATDFLEYATTRRKELFAAPVDLTFIAAWHDYKARYEDAVEWISSCVFWSVTGLGKEDVPLALAGERPKRQIPEERWSHCDTVAAHAIEDMKTAMDFAANQIGEDDRWDADHHGWVDDVETGIGRWNELTTRIGLDFRGILRRRDLVPFVLVPRKIANQQGSKERTGLLGNLKEAQDAFVSGTLVASVVLLRSTMEIVLKKHFKPFRKDTLEHVIDSINVDLPRGIKEDDLHALRLEANKLLHEGVSSMPAPAGNADQAKEITVARFLGRVDVHRSRMTVDARAMKALKLVSVLQHLVAIPLYSLSFPKKFSIRCRHL